MNLGYSPDRLDHVQLATKILQANPVLYSKISAACDIKESEVPRSLTEVILFLNLIAFSKSILTPSPFVDYVWHEFILCTRAYWNFCEATFGHMIHHHPGGTKETNRKQYQRTLDLYRQYFGPPDPCFWNCPAPTATADCGGCEADNSGFR
ncbi:MAG: hypothetical protein ABGZ23_30935 [Fuerstiella sp.]